VAGHGLEARGWTRTGGNLAGHGLEGTWLDTDWRERGWTRTGGNVYVRVTWRLPELKAETCRQPCNV